MRPEADASAGEASLARTMLRQAREMVLAGNIEASLRISREVVDRYWSKQGEKASAVAVDAFEAYLLAARSLKPTINLMPSYGSQTC